ncbi:MAG: GAF domain-containing protein [bacterium]
MRDELAYKAKLLRITNQIHTAENLDDIFLQLQFQILELFDADRITIYAVDAKNNELFSKYKIGDSVKEIRVKIDKKSISGFVAFTRTFITIADAYDEEELKRHDAELGFNKTFDQKSGFRTRQVLASAILFQRELLGVVQLINKKNGGEFGLFDMSSLKEIAKSLAIGIRNQSFRHKKVVQRFRSLIQKGLITEEGLEGIIEKSLHGKEDIIAILRREHRIEKKDILESLSSFYYCPFKDYDPAVVLDPSLLGGQPPEYFAERRWIPVRKDAGGIEVFIDDPGNTQKINEIKKFLNCQEVHLIGVLAEDIITYLRRIAARPISVS